MLTSLFTFYLIIIQLYKEHLKSLCNLVTGEMFGYLGAINEEKMAFKKNCKFFVGKSCNENFEF